MNTGLIPKFGEFIVKSNGPNTLMVKPPYINQLDVWIQGKYHEKAVSDLRPARSNPFSQIEMLSTTDGMQFKVIGQPGERILFHKEKGKGVNRPYIGKVLSDIRALTVFSNFIDALPLTSDQKNLFKAPIVNYLRHLSGDTVREAPTTKAA